MLPNNTQRIIDELRAAGFRFPDDIQVSIDTLPADRADRLARGYLSAVVFDLERAGSTYPGEQIVNAAIALLWLVTGRTDSMRLGQPLTEEDFDALMEAGWSGSGRALN